MLSLAGASEFIEQGGAGGDHPWRPVIPFFLALLFLIVGG